MVLLYVFAALALLALAVTYFAWRVTFFSSSRQRQGYGELPKGDQYKNGRKLMLSLISDLEEWPYESVETTAFDGIRLFGRYYHVRDGAPVQLQMHGYRGDAIRDFCGGAKLARQLGMNILLVDQRAHGHSGGKAITFGIRERYDCQTWTRYIYMRFGPETPIYLAGVSMGAATVLMAAGLKLPHTVRGIIADCPYSSPEAIIRKVISDDLHLPAPIVFPFVRLAARLFGNFSLRETSAAEAVSHSDIPALLIHGEDDRFVPCGMSAAIAGLCRGPCTFASFPDAGHGLSYIVDPERYGTLVADFTGGSPAPGNNGGISDEMLSGR